MDDKKYIIPIIILVLGIVYLLWEKFYTWDTDNFTEYPPLPLERDEYKIGGYFNGPESGDFNYPYRSIYSAEFNPFDDLPVYNAPV